jgi:hypothetical protein
LPEAFFPASVAVAFSENSPYKEVFSQMWVSNSKFTDF